MSPLDSLRIVWLSAAIVSSSGSCHPTRTNRAFGLMIVWIIWPFQRSTHLAWMILSGEMPRLLQTEVTLFSIHEFHSFCVALTNSAFSAGPSLRKLTSTRRRSSSLGLASECLRAVLKYSPQTAWIICDVFRMNVYRDFKYHVFSSCLSVAAGDWEFVFSSGFWNRHIYSGHLSIKRWCFSLFLRRSRRFIA